MSKCVYREAEDHNVDPYNTNFRIARSSTEVWRNEEKDTFSLLRSSFVHKTQPSGKISKYWRRESAFTLRRTNSGYLVSTNFEPRKKSFASERIIPEALPSHHEYKFMMMRKSPEFRAWLKEFDSYDRPLFEHYAIKETAIGDMRKSPLFPAMYRNETVRGFVADSFGKTRVRKDLVREAAKANIFALEPLWAVRGIVPVDWMVDALKEHNFNQKGYDDYRLRTFRNLMGHVRPATQKQMMKDVIHSGYESARLLRDIGAYMARIDEVPEDVLNSTEVVSLKNAHDKLAWYFRRKKMHQNVYKGEIEGFKEQVHEQVIGDMKIVVATHSDQVYDWGDRMSNCISSYAYQIPHANVILAAVFSGSKLVANLELNMQKDTWKLNQLLGRFNEHLEDDIRNPLEKFFEEKGVDVSNYWGKPQEATQAQPALVF